MLPISIKIIGAISITRQKNPNSTDAPYYREKVVAHFHDFLT